MGCLEDAFLETGLPAYSILGSYPKRCGEGRIRTSDAGFGGVAPFEVAAFNHSATSPKEKIAYTRDRCNCQMAYIGSLLDMVVVDLYTEVTVFAGTFGSDFSAL